MVVLEHSRPRLVSSRLSRRVSELLRALAYLGPSLLIFFFFVFLPLVRTVRLSTFATDPIGRLAGFVGMEYYARLFATPAFLNSLKRSALFVLFTVPGTLLGGLCLATLGNLRLRHISVFRMLFSSTIAVSAATASLIFMYLYHPALGSLNYLLGLAGIPAVRWLVSEATALASVSLATVWLSIGLNTIIILAGMQDISADLYESARIDGASAPRVWRSITVPLLTPTLFFLLVVDVLAALQAFTQFHVMTSGGPMDSTNVIVFSIYRQFYFNGQYGLAAAQSIMLFFVMLALTIVEFRGLERKVHYS
jgi:sn-glycerol 3-phosphate transport system permease protein